MTPQLQNAIAMLLWAISTAVFVGIMVFICAIPRMIRAWNDVERKSAEFDKEWEERKSLRRNHDSVRRVSLTTQTLNSAADTARVAAESAEKLKRDLFNRSV